MRTFISICIGLIFTIEATSAAEVAKKYFAHDAVYDRHGVIAPWYTGQNGQSDFRVRVAAETLKRYPWVTKEKAVGIAPEYAFNSTWNITPDGTITVPKMEDWTDGDRGQMAARVIGAWVEYYRYSGDPASIAHIEAVAQVLLDHAQTGADHPWPNFLISVPVKGKPYGQADPTGYIQLDIVAETGVALLQAYQLTGNQRFLDTVKHWADVLIEKRNREPGKAPWPRYANPEHVKWGTTETGNIQTGGLVYQLAMLDELLRLGYTGKENGIIEARDAGRAYMRDVLLPAWTVNDTWGRNYWDGEAPAQAQTTTDWVARYILTNKDYFENWKNDVRNILTLFFNHTSVNPNSRGEVYSGAWAFPESWVCCDTSLAWGPLELALDFARYGVEAKSEWATELARRQQILATYDGTETGVVEDNITGGPLVAGGWLKATHPSAMEWVLQTMGWMPEVFGAARENHIMRSSAVVRSVVYGEGKIAFSTFDAPNETVDVLRLAFEPKSITACKTPLSRRDDLQANGFTIKTLPNNDCIVSIRHDGCTYIVIEGDDPQVVTENAQMTYVGTWQILRSENASGGDTHIASEAGASMTCNFTGNQVRLVASVAPEGGLADVYLDDVKQLVGIDFWNPKELQQQIVYYRNGLSNGPHVLKIVATGKSNPLAKSHHICIDAVQSSSAEGKNGYGEGGGSRDSQRMIFGYTERKDYVDKQGNAWRPATEFVVRTGINTDSVATWWTSKRAEVIEGTDDPELYQYGVHAPEIVVNLTVGPGRYDVNMKFAETQHSASGMRLMNIGINGQNIIEVDVFARAGQAKKALDLVFKDISPKNGIIEIRLSGQKINDAACEAMIQALEITPSQPVTSSAPATSTNKG